MRLLASIRPPWQAIAHLEAIVRPEWAHAQQDRMRWIYPAHWRIHLASFGDVVKADVPQLCDLMAEHVSRLEAPKLRMSGVHVDAESPDAIWARVEGDESTVAFVADAIPRWVMPFGFALDRRAYRPRVTIGRTVDEDPERHLAPIVVRLGDYEGRPWVAEAVTLGYDIPATSGVDADFAVVRQAYFAGRDPDLLA
jgi:2'-5' RNA ligase